MWARAGTLGKLSWRGAARKKRGSQSDLRQSAIVCHRAQMRVLQAGRDLGHAVDGLFDTLPERPRPLVYPLVTVPLALTTSMVGLAIADDRPSLPPLAAASLLGGALIGASGATLEELLPSRGPVMGPFRCAITLASAACGGAGIGALLSARLGVTLLPVDSAVSSSLLGTSVGLMVSLAGAMLTILTGVWTGDYPVGPFDGNADNPP